LRNKTGSDKTAGVASSDWPTANEFIVCAVAAAVVVAIDIYLSGRLGLLSYPPHYDGVGWMVEAKRSFLSDGWARPDQLLTHVMPSRTPLWQLLMMLNWSVLGQGEWQAHAVRYWAVFLLLVMVVWLVRARVGPKLAWAAVAITALLPIVSVGLRSITWEFLTGRETFALEWYLDDLRPDFLSAVLLLWTVVPLVEHRRKPSGLTFAVSGTFAGLAILVKPSTSPLLLCALGLTLFYLAIVHRTDLAPLRHIVWILPPLTILLAPWVILGGLDSTITFLKHTFGEFRTLYANPHATFASESTYYLRLGPYHMGRVETWATIACVLGVTGYAFAKKKDSLTQAAFYLFLSFFLYVQVSLTPNKNYFLGLPYYLFFWVFFLVLVTSLGSPVLKPTFTKATSIATSLYAAAILIGGVVALQKWPPENASAGPFNRAVTIEMADDLQTHVEPSGCFTYLPLYGWPDSLMYYAMNKRGEVPTSPTEILDYPSPDRYIREQVASCDAVFVLEEDVSETTDYFFSQKIWWPYLRATTRFVEDEDNGYRLAKVYRFSEDTPPTTYELGVSEGRGFGVLLYLRDH
jgi:hypothetical protein